MLNNFIDLTGLETFVSKYLTDTIDANDVKHATSSKGVIDYVAGEIDTLAESINTSITSIQNNFKNYLPLTGGTVTGKVVASSFETGDDENNYFQTKKMRGQGTAGTYNHAVDWGYSGHNQVDFYEYGATWNFYECKKYSKTNAKLVGSILSTGWNGGAILSGTPTAPTATSGTNTDQIATTKFVTSAISTALPSGSELTDTKVTSAENHYTPEEADTLNTNASSTTSATWGTTSLVTGVNIGKDEKGHITSLSVDSIKLPSNPNTWRSVKVGTATLSDTSTPLTVTGSGATTVSLTDGTLNINSADTKYTGTAPISVSGTAISHNTSGVTAGTANEGGADRTLVHGESFNVPSVTVDKYGHVTSTGSTTLTLPADSNTWRPITVGDTSIEGNNLTLTAGTNVTLTATDGNVTINSKCANTEYTFGEGSSNGTFTVTPSNGSAQSVAIKGLGSLAYKNSLSASEVDALPEDTAYIKSITKNGDTLTITPSAGDTFTFTGATTTLATTSTDGLMSASDKSKLNGIDDGAEVNVIETVKVNGTALTPSSKVVNITVPTQVSQLTDASSYAKVNTTLAGYGITDAKIDATTNKITLGENSIIPLTSHQDISGKENTSNKITTWSSTPSATKYPSEKLVKEALDSKAGSSHTHTKSDISDFPTLASVATSGSYSDLTNKPSIPTVDSTLSSTSTNAIQNKAVQSALSGKANSSHTHTKSDISDFPTLATVATSGSYSDLTDTPSIPTVDSTLSSTSTNAIQNKAVQSALSGKANTSHTHTIANVTGLQSAIDGKANKATTLSGYGITNAYTKDEIDSKLSSSMKYKGQKDTYDDLPTTGNNTGDVWDVASNGHNYAWNGTSWDDLGGTVDLSNYYTKADTNTLLNNKANSATTLSGYGITDAKIANGTITLGGNTITPLTSHQDISGKENTSNKVSSWSSTTTNTKYPSEKLVKDSLDAKSPKAGSSSITTVGTITSGTWQGSKIASAYITHQDISGKENTSNKVTAWSTTVSDTKYPSEKLVKDSLDNKASSSHSHLKSEITDFPTLADVATSGSYNDLDNKPSIPTVDSALSSTSTNALQNKAIYTALSGKSGIGHGHAISDISGLQDSLDGKAGVATSLAGYGITDAKIDTSTNKITLGDNTITPLTSIPTASSTVLGGVKVGSNLSITDGKLSVPVTNNSASLSYGGTSTIATVGSTAISVTMPAQYSHPSYTAVSEGLYKITVNSLGHVSETTSVTKADITALGIPSADTNTWRAIKVAGTEKIKSSSSTALNFASGNNVSLAYDSGTLTISATDTVYSGGTGTGITVSGTTIKHSNSVTAKTESGTDGSVGYGGTINIPSITYDAQGHITGSTTTSVTLPADSNTWRPITVGTTTDSSTTLTVKASGSASVSLASGVLTIGATDTKYTHPTYTAVSAGLYKITVDSTGHVSGATKVAKDDITNLGIPSTNTTYSVATTSDNGLMSSTDKGYVMPFVMSTHQSSTASWTGTLSSVSALYNGLTIRYYLGQTPTGNATLNLTLSGSTTTGAINVYYNGSGTRVTTHYPKGSVLTLTYLSAGKNALSNTAGWFCTPQYNSTYNFGGTTFYSGASSTAEHNANNITYNGHYYYTSNGPTTDQGASTADGAIYAQSYSSSWVGQIAQDYRNGRTFFRGRNNGSWTTWLTNIDSGNIGSQSVNYATSAGSASSANKLANTSAIGGDTQPVYFTSSGVPSVIKYTIAKSVPSTAVFTDTNYYPTQFAWTSGSTAGPTGNLVGTGMSDVSFGAIPSASSTASGVVTTGTQTFAGIKTFSDDTDADSTGAGAVKVSGGIYASKNIYSATGVYNAVWNDLADCIPVDEDCTPEAGYCYCFDGVHYYKSNKYCANGIIGINSDTYGMNMGRKTGNVNQMDIAVSGFVLAYVDKEYTSGTPLTCTKDGKLTKIRLLDRLLHPHKIVATYWKNEPAEEWGSETRKVKVNGRKWVKVR